MLFVLGIGSVVALVSSVITIIWDECPKFKYWQVAIFVSIAGFLGGLIYITPVSSRVNLASDVFELNGFVFCPGRTVDVESG